MKHLLEMWGSRLYEGSQVFLENVFLKNLLPVAQNHAAVIGHNLPSNIHTILAKCIE